MSEVQATNANARRATAYGCLMPAGYDLDRASLKQTCEVCRKIIAVHKSIRNEVRMRSTIVAVLSLFMATAVLAWEPKDAPAHLPDNGGPPRVYYAHSYFEETPHLA